MPLSALSLSQKVSFAFSKTNNGGAFGPTSQGPNTEILNLIGISLSTWNQAFTADYVLFVANPSGLAASLVSGGTLTVSTTYYYKITAIAPNSTNNEETSGSNEVSATPTSGNQSIKLTWTQLSGAQGYNIYRGTATNTENLLVGTVSSGSTLTFTDTGFAGTSQSPPASLPNDYVEFVLNSFTNLNSEAVTAGHILGLLLFPSGANAQCTLTPAASNGMTWLWPSGTNPGNNVPVSAKGGLYVIMGAIDNAGTAISGSTKGLRITNGGTGALTVTVVAIVGP